MGKTFFLRDFALFGYPLAEYHRACFWRGELPLWNPYNNCGLPFLAQWNALTLYPLSLIYLLLPLSWSLGFFCLAHLFLGGLGMFKLARAWTRSDFAGAVAGLAFAFNGLTLSSLKWPNNIAALGWVPWVILLSEWAWKDGGRAVLWAALVGALQMLSGAPEIILFTWVLTAAFWAGDWIVNPRWILAGRMAVVVALVAGLAAVQLLPFFELLRQSQRSESFGGSLWAMPAWGWANFLVPLFRCFPQHQNVYAQFGQYWVSSYYLPIALLPLAIVGSLKAKEPRVRVAWVVLALSLALALGDAGGLYPIIQQTIPQAGFMRFPIKFVVLAEVLIPLLAAFGLAKWETEPERVRGLVFRATAVVGVGIVVIATWASLFPLPVENSGKTLINALTRLAWLGLALWFLAKAMRGQEQTAPSAIANAKSWQSRLVESRGVLSLAFCFVLVADVVTHAPRLAPTVERWVYQPSSAETEIVKMQPQPAIGRARAMLSSQAEWILDHLIFTNAIEDVLYSRKSLFCNMNLIDRLPKVDGFYSLYLRNTQQVLSLLYASTNASYPNIIDFLAVTQETKPGTVLEWRPRDSALSWISGGQTPRFADAQTTRASLAKPDFDPRRTVYLPLEAQSQVGLPTNQVQITLKVFSAHRIEFECQSHGPAMITLAQAFYPAWEARVDANPTRIWIANHGFQAIAVPAGRHNVVFEYKAKTVRLGFAITLATALIALSTVAKANGWR